MTALNHNEEYNRLMDAARRRASELRREAIDRFWDDAGMAAGHALHSAVRLASRLARHASQPRQRMEG